MKIELNLGALKRTKVQEYFVRFAFGGALTVLAGIIAKYYGPVVGGLFLAAPAIFPAAATLLEKHEEKEQRAKAGKEPFARKVAGVDAAGAAMGSIGLIAFGVVIWQLLPRYSIAAVLGAAVLAWTAVAVGIWSARKFLLRRIRARRSRHLDHVLPAHDLPQSKRPQ